MTPYDIDESLLPERNIQVICRVCLNVFTLNKSVGVVTPGSPQKILQKEAAQELSQKPLYERQEVSEKSLELQEDISNINQQTILKEIRKAVALDGEKMKELQRKENKKADKKSTNIFLTVLIIILLVAAVVIVLDYFGIIQLPFLKDAILKIKNLVSYLQL